MIALAGTAVYTQLEADTSYTLLAVALYVRGIGLGMTMMPAMAAAYQTLDRPAVPRATTAINIIRTVGGSLGTAILSVVLERQIAAELGGAAGDLGALRRRGGGAAQLAEPLAHAFGQTFWWAVGLTALALIPALFLPRHPARARRPAPVPAPATSKVSARLARADGALSAQDRSGARRGSRSREEPPSSLAGPLSCAFSLVLRDVLELLEADDADGLERKLPSRPCCSTSPRPAPPPPRRGRSGRRRARRRSRRRRGSRRRRRLAAAAPPAAAPAAAARRRARAGSRSP